MAKGDRSKAAVLRRIAESAHSLTVNYPPQRTPAVAFAVAPIAPLTGPRSPATLLPGAPPTPEKSAVVMKCLWYDSPQTSALGVSNNRRSFGTVGWRQGAQALARVTVTEAAIDPTKPYERTVFDECESVTHAGLRYKVVSLTRTDAGFALPYSYYVWLSTSELV